MNNQLVIDRIYSTDGTHSSVHLAQACFNRLMPNATEPVKSEVLGWTSRENGEFVRKYDFNGVEVTSIWNPVNKSRFIVTNEVAKAHFVAEVKKVISLPFDISKFQKVATA